MQPHLDIIQDVLPHFGPAEVRPCVTPWSLRTPVIIEIDAALVILAPTIKLPDVKVIIRAEVVIDNVEDNRYAPLVGFVDKAQKLSPAPIETLNCIDIIRGIPPTPIHRHAVDRHQLD